MATIYEEISAPIIASRWNERVQERQPYLGEAFFPETRQRGIKLSILKGNAPKIRPLNLSSFDAKVIPLSREAFEKIETEMPFFKNSLPINEELRQDLLVMLQTGNRELIDPLLNRYFDDQETLLNNAAITREMLRMQIMTSGVIGIANNGQNLALDFGVPTENKVKSNWNVAATADPVNDIIGWCDMVEQKTGRRPRYGLINSTTLAKWQKADSVKNAVYVFGQGVVTPNRANAQRYVEGETGVRFFVYDKGYTDEATGRFVKFVADDTVSLFTDTIGAGVYGTTPEQADLMAGTDAVVSIVDGGVAITTWKEKDPVYVNTKVSMIYLPVLTAPQELVIADVSGN